MKKIRIGILGVGNCASSLIQGIEYYANKSSEDGIGIMHWQIGGYKPSDIEVKLAIDIDKRKVGKDISEAIFSKPNCTRVFFADVPRMNVEVKMGRVLDGVPKHMEQFPEDESFCVSDKEQPSKEQVIQYIKESGIDILVNYLPVGSEKAVRFYVECALEAGVGFINNMPVFIASDRKWIKKFEEKNIPIIGDDIKSQIGATIVHRTLADLFRKRGVIIDKSYQLNVGGNTDFMNMLDRYRLNSKKISKTEAVQSLGNINEPTRNLHVGPSDYVPFLDDNKLCFVRMEGRIFGDTPINLELRLSVEDSPNSAGVVIDAIRCCKIALENNIGGVLLEPSSFFCKHPMKQFTDNDAYKNVEKFIEKYSNSVMK